MAEVFKSFKKTIPFNESKKGRVPKRKKAVNTRQINLYQVLVSVIQEEVCYLVSSWTWLLFYLQQHF